ncbi:hypothetical protein HSX11_01520 [Oxalobacteraceae bacterium]|nr:hypothetical protein [Oxalobacteraceae bacterium]
MNENTFKQDSLMPGWQVGPWVSLSGVAHQDGINYALKLGVRVETIGDAGDSYVKRDPFLWEFAESMFPGREALKPEFLGEGVPRPGYIELPITNSLGELATNADFEKAAASHASIFHHLIRTGDGDSYSTDMGWFEPEQSQPAPVAAAAPQGETIAKVCRLKKWKPTGRGEFMVAAYAESYNVQSPYFYDGREVERILASPVQPPAAQPDSPTAADAGGLSFDAAWDSIDWDQWRMPPIRELVRHIHSLTTPRPTAVMVGDLSDEQYQEVLRPILSREGMRRYLNSDPITLDPSDYRAIIDAARLTARGAGALLQDWAALGYVVGATVEQDSGKYWASQAVITFVHGNGALDVTAANGTKYGWSAARCKVVAPRPTASGAVDLCAWTINDHENMIWQSSCGEAWSFVDGGPVENGVKFCQGCGKAVDLRPAANGAGGQS